MVTQKELAQKAGVSISTVSRVLAGAGDKYASAAVRDLVWAKAKELGYTPNPTARSLRLGSGTNVKHPRLVVILARPTAGEEDFFFRELARAVDEEMLRQGLPVAPTMTVQQQLAQGSVAGVQGVLLLGRCSRETVRQLEKNFGGVPMVGVGLNPSGRAEMDQVFCNGRAAAEVAVRYLLEQGHTRIAYLGECSVESRYAGYYDTLVAAGAHYDRELVVEAAQTQAGGLQAARKLLERATGATAIFCANDNVAIGAVAALRQAGVHIPTQMGVVSIDDIEPAQFCNPRLTTIHIPKDEMGRLAVKLLLDRLSGGHSELLRLELPARLVRRESC